MQDWGEGGVEYQNKIKRWMDSIRCPGSGMVLCIWLSLKQGKVFVTQVNHWIRLWTARGNDIRWSILFFFFPSTKENSLSIWHTMLSGRIHLFRYLDSLLCISNFINISCGILAGLFHEGTYQQTKLVVLVMYFVMGWIASPKSHILKSQPPLPLNMNL